MCATYQVSSETPPADLLVAFPAGEYVFREGDLGTEMFIVHEGRVEILQRVGGELRRFAVLEKGDFFGEMSLLEELPRNASARALTDVRLLQIDGATFDRMLRMNPEIGVRIMRKLSRRVRETDQLLRQALASHGAAEDTESPTIRGTRTADAALHNPCRLVDEKSGTEFQVLIGTESTIGRLDPVTGIRPSVDLTPVDDERSSSRRHAKIYREGEKVFLVEDLGTLNGTFVNGTRLKTGVAVEIHDGDTLRFGLSELRFLIDQS